MINISGILEVKEVCRFSRYLSGQQICISSSIDPKSICSLSWIAMILPMRVVHAFAVVFRRCSYCSSFQFFFSHMILFVEQS